VFDVADAEPGDVTIAPIEQPRSLKKRLVLGAVSVAIVVSILGVVLAANSARSGYFVVFDGERADAVLVIKQGSPSGWLWIQPTIAETSPITRQDVLPALESELDRVPRFDSLTAARRYVTSIAEVVSE